jgi:hypothetical protein
MNNIGSWLQAPTKSESTTIEVSNSASMADPVWTRNGVNSYNVTPRSVPVDAPVAARPLSAATVRMMDSLLQARVPEASILRDEEGD